MLNRRFHWYIKQYQYVSMVFLHIYVDNMKWSQLAVGFNFQPIPEMLVSWYHHLKFGRVDNLPYIENHQPVDIAHCIHCQCCTNDWKSTWNSEMQQHGTPNCNFSRGGQSHFKIPWNPIPLFIARRSDVSSMCQINPTGKSNKPTTKIPSRIPSQIMEKWKNMNKSNKHHDETIKIHTN